MYSLNSAIYFPVIDLRMHIMLNVPEADVMYKSFIKSDESLMWKIFQALCKQSKHSISIKCVKLTTFSGTFLLLFFNNLLCKHSRIIVTWLYVNVQCFRSKKMYTTIPTDTHFCMCRTHSSYRVGDSENFTIGEHEFKLFNLISALDKSLVS